MVQNARKIEQNKKLYDELKIDGYLYDDNNIHYFSKNFVFDDVFIGDMKCIKSGKDVDGAIVYSAYKHMKPTI